MKYQSSLILTTLALAGCSLSGFAAEGLGYQDSPLIPGTQWHVHDGERPQPVVITPGTVSTPQSVGTAPSDAVVLFDGKDLSKWVNAKSGEPAAWKMENGAMEINKTGYIATKASFGPDVQFHIEWATPTPATGKGQGRSNSGIFFYGQYEIQVQDNFDNQTYPDGQAGAVYGQTPPLVNASLKAGEWQTYDIVFNGPRFKDDKVETPAYVTVFHNGILVQNHTQLQGGTEHKKVASYHPHGEKGIISLQDHGNPVRFRNIWIRELKPVDSK
jgi:Domain of Unknown Function (DUF1080)